MMDCSSYEEELVFKTGTFVAITSSLKMSYPLKGGQRT